MISAHPADVKMSAHTERNHKDVALFLGTANPRHLRVIQALVGRSQTRENIDQVGGCSNGPELIAELRRRGLKIPCTRTKKKDRDLFDCYPGVYCLTQRDRRKIAAWKRRVRDTGNWQLKAKLFSPTPLTICWLGSGPGDLNEQ